MGQAHGMSRTPLYAVWQNMKERCERTGNRDYKYYGGKGIEVCDDWHNSSSFFKWALGNGYQLGLKIDRIDNNGNYCPENCRFVNHKTNCRNRRNTVFFTLMGDTKSVAEWCELLSVCRGTVHWWRKEHGDAYAESRLTDVMVKKGWCN